MHPATNCISLGTRIRARLSDHSPSEKTLWVLSQQQSAQKRLSLDYADNQAVLSIHWVYITLYCFGINWIIWRIPLRQEHATMCKKYAHFRQLLDIHTCAEKQR